jgi:hypothetical protein
MTLTLSPASKMQHAPCRELSNKEKDLVFYPKSGTGYKRAKTMCGGCLDKDECLAQALSFEVPGEERYGIWGGLSARERERLVEGDIA